tara:strand:+ start:1359 stop:2387 length:1029 start_codon:yes stop_codon:yes gene_type:complete
MSLKNLSVTKKIPKLFKNKLKNKRIKNIYKSFEKSLDINEDFVVAVSGGPDSLALAFLAKIYSIKKKLNSKFFIVDHKLRKNSSKEAEYVKSILKRLSINAEILTWNGRKPTRNIQSISRKKRYQLLFNKSNYFKISNILLGHHIDDLFENFFIRILRGSGLKGLISLDKKTTIKNINLLRPLLYEQKSNLIFVAKYVFNFYVEDPTNEDEKFQRIRIRKFIKKLELNGLDEKKFLNTLINLKHSNNVVNYYVKKNLKENSFFNYKKNQIILNKKFFIQPHEIVFRAFSDSLKIIGNKYYHVRGKKINKIIDEIMDNCLSKTTLGGCIIKKVEQTVIISKEH